MKTTVYFTGTARSPYRPCAACGAPATIGDLCAKCHDEMQQRRETPKSELRRERRESVLRAAWKETHLWWYIHGGDILATLAVLLVVVFIAAQIWASLHPAK